MIDNGSNEELPLTEGGKAMLWMREFIFKKK